MALLDPTIALFFDGHLHRNPDKLLAVFPLHYWRRADREGARTETGVLLALLMPYDDTRLGIRYVPGVTGHEGSFFDDAFIEQVEQTPCKVPIEPGEIDFGGTGTKNAKWGLNGGGAVYDSLWVSVKGIKAMTEHFKPSLEAWKTLQSPLPIEDDAAGAGVSP